MTRIGCFYSAVGCTRDEHRRAAAETAYFDRRFRGAFEFTGIVGGRDEQIIVLEASPGNLYKSLMSTTRSHNALRIELDFPLAAISRKEVFIRLFFDSACTWYSSLKHVHSTSYYYRLNSVLDDAQMRGKYLREFFVQVSENGHPLQIK